MHRQKDFSRKCARERQARRNGTKRILLASSNTQLVSSLTRQLSQKGHRVWTINEVDEGPKTWSPHLYDIVVFTAKDEPAILKQICEPAKRSDPGLLLVMLTCEPFGTACGIPDAIITEREEPAIAEKLLAVVNGVIQKVA